MESNANGDHYPSAFNGQVKIRNRGFIGGNAGGKTICTSWLTTFCNKTSNI